MYTLVCLEQKGMVNTKEQKKRALDQSKYALMAIIGTLEGRFLKKGK